MQQINVIVTPKAKQTISVTVNGVAMSVVNSDGSYSTTHYSGTPFIIPNITVIDSDGSTYSHPSVKDVVCTPPVGADVENSDGSYTQHVNNGATLVLPDTEIKNTAGATILTQPSATSTGVIADSVVTNSDNTFSLNVPAETNPVLANITHIDSDLTPVVLPAMTPMVCTPVAAPTYASAKLMKTGQTTSYRTGDDGDFEAGREDSFFVLKENNPFGNTNRFTDELGGQTYTNNIVIDWSTHDGISVLGYYRNLMAAVIWDEQIDACLALSIGTYISGWRLFNFIECVNIMNFGASGVYKYAPFNINSAVYVRTSTTYSNTSYSFDILLNGGQILANPKANAGYGIAVRTFNVNGTTLT